MGRRGRGNGGLAVPRGGRPVQGRCIDRMPDYSLKRSLEPRMALFRSSPLSSPWPRGANLLDGARMRNAPRWRDALLRVPRQEMPPIPVAPRSAENLKGL